MNPAHLHYTENHEWVRDDGVVCVVGVTAYTAEQLGDITIVELPEVGMELTQNEQCGTVESVNDANDLYAPVGGRVCEVNDELEANPGLINRSPYRDGWLFKLEDVDVSEFDALMSAAEYEAFLKAL